MTATGDIRRTLADDVYARIRTALHTGALKPGQKLRFSELQTLTDTSVTPIREALARLTAEGFTALESHRGYSVAPVSSDDLWDTVRNRQRLEAEALRLSIANGDEHWEASLMTAYHLLTRIERERADFPTVTNDEWERRHAAFHESLISGCKSKILLGFCNQLYARSDRYRRLSVAVLDAPRDIKTEHRLIFEATIQRNADGAVKLLQQHFERTAAIVEHLLTQM
jgi:DNA-binding GntR family transcriptional regulator